MGPVPQVKTTLSRADKLDALWARLGPGRGDYAIAPGLYCVGEPDKDSAVLVTANYGLTFSAIRKELAGEDLWLLVLDTRGINVWCAAGKELFSTHEAAYRVQECGLERVVAHRELVMPQLGATGVSARELKKLCGFGVKWGPVRAGDIKEYLHADKVATQAMRSVDFPMIERFKLLPVELYQLRKLSVWIVAALFLISGLAGTFYSLGAAWQRGLMSALAYFAGVLGGAVAAPLLLPWLPGRALALKGGLTGLVLGAAVAALFQATLGWWGMCSLALFSMAVSSFLAMNFTGATPYTSPSGVEKEMRRFMPVQALALLLSLAGWIGAGYTGW
ncbi:MAG: hypothetical protein D6E12_14920 [Desulfovibrio sp.]|nr:MAG: hypothetical protein D6E12_14920 [Desulfovibrio sp.]